MSFRLEAIGKTGDDQRYEVTEEALQAYAAATDDVVGGPVFAVLPMWEAAGRATRSVASDDVRSHIVHYEQDLLFHQPLVAGMRVRSRATPARPHRPSQRNLARHEDRDAHGGRRARERAVRDRRSSGASRHRRASASAPPTTGSTSTDAPVAEITYPVAEDQTVRYAAASGDHFAIHLDDEFARSVGLPGRIVHGLCTMAFTGRAVLEAAGVESPSRVRRLAVRFSAPLFPGDTLTTRIWDLGDGSYGFEAASGQGATVVKDGRADLRPM